MLSRGLTLTIGYVPSFHICYPARGDCTQSRCSPHDIQCSSSDGRDHTSKSVLFPNRLFTLPVRKWAATHLPFVAVFETQTSLKHNHAVMIQSTPIHKLSPYCSNAGIQAAIMNSSWSTWPLCDSKRNYNTYYYKQTGDFVHMDPRRRGLCSLLQ